MSDAIQLSKEARAREGRCPLCFEAVRAEDGDLESCPGCATTYHPDCLAELGGCSTLGCSAALARPARAVTLPAGRVQEEEGEEPDFSREEAVERALKVLFGLALGVGAALVFEEAGAGTGPALGIGAGFAATVAFVLLNPRAKARNP